MAKKQLEFPQISRIFTALLEGGLKNLVIGAAAAFLIYSFFFTPAESFNFKRAKLTAMLYPNDQSAHFLLAQEYLKKGNMEGVERELLLAENLSRRPASSFQPPASSVLGTFLSPLKILEKIKNEPQRIREEIAFWKNIIKDKPDYRDAYLQLAILNYQLYEKEKAKEYLEKGLELDPNFEPAKKLKEIID